MRAIVVMFDSLNRRMLPAYGETEIHAPNFERLAKRTVTFDQCYAGSMPCMPARREMHTGRHNFLHRSWGPLEPFDDSVPELLKRSGVYTHLATDHPHYWEDGGATYHSRFNSFEFFRGQEGDHWKGHVADPVPPPTLNPGTPHGRQDWVNRQYMTTEAEHPQTLTFDAGLHFMQTNVDEDNWLVQIETFDPHEPFFSYADYRDSYGPERDFIYDWPPYRRDIETEDERDELRRSYFALVSMCDRSLGRVLDFMDEHDMWDDTMLIVCTDHGFLLGEKGWWGKTSMPWYDETIHTPLHVWDPRSGVAGERRESLVQTIDIGPTLLDLFDQPLTDNMQGRPLAPVVADDTSIRKTAIFGAHGGHVNITDGRYVYMRACATPDNQPLFEYTLMPTHMRGFFTPPELRNAELAEGFSFTKEMPVLRVPGWAMSAPSLFGTLLFDLDSDPEQQNPLRDEELEKRMAQALVDAMRASDAPLDQYIRLGLPTEGPVTDAHLLIPSQWDAVQQSMRRAPLKSEFPPDAVVSSTPIAELMIDERRRDIIMGAFPSLEHPQALAYLRLQTPLSAAAFSPTIDAAKMFTLEESFQAETSESPAAAGG